MLCFTMTHWQIMMCSYFIHAKSAQRAWISFMLLNKHGNTVVSVIDFADWRILMRHPRKSWGKLMNIYCSKQSVLKSCLSQSLNSVFQLNFDPFFFTIHAYNFTSTRNLISSKLKTFKGPRITETYTRESPFFYSVR